ncbi:MAG: molybdopterin-synthase adenylyltransferase MoeB [Gammaproteobacteria bacterium]|nr:molybdopterin-synthase adenylyltransferase MoeB [Gammaproteobacteria bacterium]MAY03359.1 molybdopterin-synthase adenylyltransferase MoeB [Gammaproteobacteria bacterium]|tara:strand:- start:799 stop:1560 length:762 start_codon:yes stop_codon:yes gene_type:complete
MHDDQLLRYSRQIMLPEMDIAGQEKLLDASVLVIGAGGLGCPAAMYLASAGVGHLTLADHDRVELSNLQRQIGHQTSSIGLSKVASLKETLLQLNPEVKITALLEKLAGDTLGMEIKNADVVLDCTDNFESRLAINSLSRHYKVPLVSGAAIRMEAQLSVFDQRDASSPCYQCLYEVDSDMSLSCSESGVMAPLVGIIGSMQAMEAIKLIAGIGQVASARLLLLDAASMQWREMKLQQDPACPVCNPSRQANQ